MCVGKQGSDGLHYLPLIQSLAYLLNCVSSFHCIHPTLPQNWVSWHLAAYPVGQVLTRSSANLNAHCKAGPPALVAHMHHRPLLLFRIGKHFVLTPVFSFISCSMLPNGFHCVTICVARLPLPHAHCSYIIHSAANLLWCLKREQLILLLPSTTISGIPLICSGPVSDSVAFA